MVLAFACPTCLGRLTKFEISVKENNCIDLEAVCHPCKTIMKIVVTFEDLKEIGRGQAVEVIEKSEAMFVM
jgi:hypothetical protein